ncbi:hypothetical protein M3Y99_01652600 [Aphelenchoides fujianensis]|nr:hypothetical protein M3Y99_01652600 [Aphelenchoides fujianensis]
MLSLRSLALVCIAVPLATMALDCRLKTDPLHAVGKAVESAVKGEDPRSYTCTSPDDKYCVYFEGSLEVGGENKTFSAASCSSDIEKYLGPIGEKIGKTIHAKCEKTGVVRDKIGPLSYYFNCCTENGCNTPSGAATAVISYGLMTLSALVMAVPLFS